MTYGLNENDVNMLVSMADEDQDELIDWQEFLPIGIRIIRTIYKRNLSGQFDAIQPDHEKAVKLVHCDEVARTNTLLCYDFKKADTAKTGIINLSDFKHIVRASRLMTPKEKNLIIRSIMAPTVKYAEFPDMLYKARFQIASSRLMETGIDQLEYELLTLFEAADQTKDGTISIADCEKALFACKYLHLTPF